MKYIKQVCIIFGITMAGEILNACLPLPVPSGVYGLFLLLLALCTKLVKVSDVEDVGSFLLDIMPMMFIPVSVGVMESFAAMKIVMVPLLVITLLSTIIVMVVTGKITELIIRIKRKRGSQS